MVIISVYDLRLSAYNQTTKLYCIFRQRVFFPRRSYSCNLDCILIVLYCEFLPWGLVSVNFGGFSLHMHPCPFFPLWLLKCGNKNSLSLVIGQICFHVRDVPYCKCNTVIPILVCRSIFDSCVFQMTSVRLGFRLRCCCGERCSPPLSNYRVTLNRIFHLSATANMSPFTSQPWTGLDLCPSYKKWENRYRFFFFFLEISKR